MLGMVNKNYNIIYKMAELLIQNKTELSDGNVSDLLRDATDKDKMAQIINKYHTKKTPEIQELIDKYI